MVTSNRPFSEWTEVLGSERLTGTRFRQIPFTPERVKAALSARA